MVVKPISTRFRTLRRLGGFSLSAFQFAAFAALPAADAVLETRGRSAVPHIEDESNDHCETGHSHLLCQLTRTLSSGGSAPIPADLQPAAETDPAPPAAFVRQDRPIPPGGSGPRAPPRA